MNQSAGDNGRASSGDAVTTARVIPEQVMWLAHQIERVTNAHLASGVVPLPHGMTLTRASLLLAINARPAGAGVRMNELATDLGITARTMTTLVDALEGQGLVARTADPRDRRAITLSLGLDAAPVMAALRQAIDAISAAIVAPLDLDEQRHLAALMRRLIEPES